MKHMKMFSRTICMSPHKLTFFRKGSIFAICPALVSLCPMFPMKEAEPDVVYCCCCCCAFRDNVIDDTVVTGGCFPVNAELPMFLFYAPLSVSSRDCCAWKSPEISRFWDTQTSPGRRGRKWNLEMMRDRLKLTSTSWTSRLNLLERVQ